MLSKRYEQYMQYLVFFVRKYAILLVMICLLAIFAFIRPIFFSKDNFVNILTQNAYIIIASVGMTFVMISGGIDLSAGYQISLVGIVTAILMKWLMIPIPAALIVGMLLGALLGFLNGFISIRLKLHSMITTLATMTVYQGISYLISRSNPIYGFNPAFTFIGQGYVGPFPFCVLLTAVVVVTAHIILSNTYYGRYIYALGGNESAARLSGVNINMVRISVFVICGFFIALSSIVLVSRSGSANSSVGVGTEFTCITAAVLGGISFKGGEGKIWGVVVGELILGILSNGMQIIGLGIYPQYIAKGIVLLAAVAFDNHQKAVAVNDFHAIGMETEVDDAQE